MGLIAAAKKGKAVKEPQPLQEISDLSGPRRRWRCFLGRQVPVCYRGCSTSRARPHPELPSRRDPWRAQRACASAHLSGSLWSSQSETLKSQCAWSWLFTLRFSYLSTGEEAVDLTGTFRL